MAATDPLPGLTDAQWEELIQLAVQKVVEAEFCVDRAAVCPARRKAA